MICWYCKNLIPDDTHVCPYCRVAVVKPASEEFRQNGYVNPYEQYYHNYQLPQQMNSGYTGQYYKNTGMQAPQYPVNNLQQQMPMQNPYAPYQVLGVIYPQAQRPQEKVWVKPKEGEKPEIEDIVKDEPAVILQPSELNGNYAAGSVNSVKVETASEDVAEPKKKNVIAIVGFIFAFILPLIGLILSCVGVARAETKNYDKCGLAIGGVVVSIVLMIAYPALMFLFSEPLLTMLGL